MYSLQKVIYCLAFLIVLISVSGQKKYMDYNYSIKNGLNSDNILSTAISKSGELYLSTQRGISLYDGYRFQNHATVQTIIGSFIENDNFFFYFNTDGLCKIHQINDIPEILVKNIYTDSNPNNDQFNNLFIDSKKRIWGTDFENVKYYDPITKKVISFSLIPGNKHLDPETGIIETANGEIWIAAKNGLWVWKENAKELKPYPYSNFKNTSFQSIKKLSNGKVLLSTSQGKIFQINPITNELINLKSLPDNQMITGFEETSEGLALHGIHSVYLSKNNTYHLIYSSIDQTINHLTYDPKTHIIWLSTSKGLIKLLPVNPAISIYTFNERNAPVVSIAQDNQNTIWMIDAKGMLGTLNKNGLQPFNPSANFEYSSLNFSANQLFLSGTKEIKILKNNVFINLPLKDLSIQSQIVKTIITPQNELWIVFLSHEIQRYRWPSLEKIDEPINNKPEFWADNQWQDVVIDKSNRIWLAGWMPKSYGICYYDPANNEFIDVSKKEINPDKGKFVGDYFTKTGLGNENSLLFTAYGGWNRTDGNGKIIQKVDIHSYEIADTHLRGIAEDSKGNVYFATSEGLHIYRKDIDKVVRITQIDGLPSNFTLHSFYELNDGKIALGIEGGMVIIETENLLKTQLTQRLKLVQIKVNGESRSINSHHIELQKDERELILNFSDLSFLDSEKVNFRYKFSDEKNWHELGNNPELSLNHIQPGSYDITIEAWDNLGNIQSKNLNISILAHPPFTKSNLFYALLLTTLFAIIFLINRYLWKRKEKEQKYLRRIKEAEMQTLRSQMNPHFLFNTLNSINSYIIQNESETASAYLTTFSKLMRNILDNSKHEMISLKKEMQTLKLYLELESARLEHSFDYKFKIDPNIDSEYLQIPPLIIQPFTENAIWHGLRNRTDKGLLEVIVNEIDDETLQIIVQDNGIGREASRKLKKEQTQHKSYGIEITTERLKTLDPNNSVEINDLYDADETSAGTQIIITLKLKEND
ncbi:sensor histidine kinase [Moheibacter sediminis]|uniref:Histidine kinase n=1 Tax=Moheibacter sediminis TaxID=1434700 RepID=A0A1W2AK06_9FLAO|nr:histidine kinase [Moheibacter sediminis]SMC61025.1 Histidine kinase [Moheibacter sediminis]